MKQESGVLLIHNFVCLMSFFFHWNERYSIHIYVLEGRDYAKIFPEIICGLLYSKHYFQCRYKMKSRDAPAFCREIRFLPCFDDSGIASLRTVKKS